MNIIRILKLRELNDELIINSVYERYFLSVLNTCKINKKDYSQEYHILDYRIFIYYTHINQFQFIENTLTHLLWVKFKYVFSSDEINTIIQNFFNQNNINIQMYKPPVEFFY